MSGLANRDPTMRSAIVEFHRRRAAAELRAALNASSQRSRLIHTELALHHELAAYRAGVPDFATGQVRSC